MAASIEPVSPVASVATSARTPQELKASLEHLSPSATLPTIIEIHLYHKLFEDSLDKAQIQKWAESGQWERKVIDLIFSEWADAIKGAALPALPKENPPLHQPRICFIFDVRGPSHLADKFIVRHDAPGLHRITALLERRLRQLGTVEATISGVECWCKLQKMLKHIAMPQGKSYPLYRESHGKREVEEVRAKWRDPEYSNAVMLGGSRLSYEERSVSDFNWEDHKGLFERKCLKLAREHWDDEYWSRKMGE
jgi:hypothetical protein